MKDIPIKGKTYNCFDDGKISESRLYTVDVSEVIPFNEIDKKTLKEWKTRVDESYWLFNKKQTILLKRLTERMEMLYL